MADISKLNTEALSQLSPEEKEIALKMLKDISNGDNSLYNKLKYKDYDEIPVDIETFLFNDRYLGRGLIDSEGRVTVFPYWVETLKKIFPNNTDIAYNTLILTGSIGTGKEQPISSLVLTENGFLPMGNIKPGMKVYSRDGKLCNVVDIFPQGIKDVYEFTFSDGSKVKCGLNHLWQVTDHHYFRNHKQLPATTMIVDTNYLLNHALKNGKQNRYSIPLCNPIEFKHQETFISPYMMGCLLGDGCFRFNLQFTSQDNQILDMLDEELKLHGYSFTKILHKGSKALDCKITKNIRGPSSNIYIKELKRLGLWNKLANEKHIPQEYLYNDVNSRVELLQGLLDTDGEARKSLRRCDNTYSYNIGFSTTSMQLKNDIIWLVQSLGGVVKVKKKTNKKYHYKYKNIDEYRKCKDYYNLSIQLPTSIQPFKLNRKANLYNSCPHKEPSKYIVKIDKLDYQEESQCILVDNPEHLYITNNFTVTHNTMMAVLCMLYMLYRMLCLKDPYLYYGLQPIDKITFSFINVTIDAAKGVAWDKIQQLLQTSPWFMEHGTVSGRSDLVWSPSKRIELVIGSNNNAIIGRALICSFEDEINFASMTTDVEKIKAKAKHLISQVDARMQSRFMKGTKLPTLNIIASSKTSDQSFLDSYINTKKKNNSKTTLIIDEPQWVVRNDKDSPIKFWVAVGNKFLASEILPRNASEKLVDSYRAKGYQMLQVPIGYWEAFNDNVELALTDIAGISTTSALKYISGIRLNEIKNSNYFNPFTRDIIEVGTGDKLQYSQFFNVQNIPISCMRKPLYIHLDMSKSGDKTGIAGIWIMGKRPSQDNANQSKEAYYRVAFSVSVKAPKGYEISFEKNRTFIRWLKSQGLNIKGVTMDTYQSAQIKQQLIADGFDAEILSVDRLDNIQGTKTKICLPYAFFKSAIYEHRLELYNKCDLLTDEIVGLEKEPDGHIQHPEGGTQGSKDQVDAVCGSLYNASQHIEQYAFDYGEDIDDVLNTNTLNENSPQMRQQINIDFEKALQEILMPKSIKEAQEQEKKIQTNNSYNNIPIIGDSMLIW